MAVFTSDFILNLVNHESGKEAFPVLTLCKIKLILFHNSYPSVMTDSYALKLSTKGGEMCDEFP